MLKNMLNLIIKISRIQKNIKIDFISIYKSILSFLSNKLFIKTVITLTFLFILYMYFDSTMTMLFVIREEFTENLSSAHEGIYIPLKKSKYYPLNSRRYRRWRKMQSKNLRKKGKHAKRIILRKNARRKTKQIFDNPDILNDISYHNKSYFSKHDFENSTIFSFKDISY